jgi:dihydroflavonol-4-reductase
VCINPAVVIGPARSAQHARTSLQILDELDRGVHPGCPNLFFSFVDVRDVARAHVEALANPAIEGRVLMPGHSISMPALSQMIKRLVNDSKAPKQVIPDWAMYLSAPFVRRLSLRYLRRHLGVEYRFDDARARAYFPWCYRGLEETVVDSVRSLRQWSPRSAKAS